MLGAAVLLIGCGPRPAETPKVVALSPPPLPEPPTQETWHFTDATPVTALLSAEGVLYAGTTRGVLRFDHGSGDARRLSAADGIVGDHVTALALDGDKRLWVATKKGLSRQQGDAFEALPRALPEGASPRALATDSEGTVWIGGSFGLVRSGAGGFLAIQDEIKVTALAAAPGGGLWIGTESDGILFLGEERLRQYLKGHGIAGAGAGALGVASDGTVVATSPRGEARNLISIFDGSAWFPYRLQQEGVLWEVLGTTTDARGHIFHTPFGFYRLRRVQVPADPAAAVQVMAELESKRPLVVPLEVVVPKEALEDEEADGEEEDAEDVVTGLPPLPDLKPPSGPAERAEWDAAKAVAGRARAAYQRAAADFSALEDELAALKTKREEAVEKAAELDAQLGKRTLQRKTAEGADAEPGEEEEQLEASLAEAKAESRSAGVSYQLMAERYAKAETETEAAHKEAMLLQGGWVALSAPEGDDGGSGSAFGKSVAGSAKQDVGEGDELTRASVPIHKAAFSDRKDLTAPRFLLERIEGLKDLPPALVTARLGAGKSLWLGTGTQGVLRLVVAKRSHLSMEDLVPSTAAAGPVGDVEGHVWVAAEGADHVHRFDGRTWHRVRVASEGEVSAIAADSGGALWALSRHQEIFRLHKWDGDAFQPRFQAPVGEALDAIHVQSFGVGPEGTAWLAVGVPGPGGAVRPAGALSLPVPAASGTPKPGAIPATVAHHHRREPAAAFAGTEPGLELPTDRISGISTAGIVTYLATTSGLCAISGGKVEIIGENEGLESEVLRGVVLDDASQPWVATGVGVGARAKSGRWSFRAASAGLPSLAVIELSIGPDGELWALTEAGLARRRQNAKAWTAAPMPHLDPGAGLGLLVDSRGRRWVRTAHALLMHAD